MTLYGFFYSLVYCIIACDFSTFQATMEGGPVAGFGYLKALFDYVCYSIFGLWGGGSVSVPTITASINETISAVLALLLTISFIWWLVRLILSLFTLNRWR